MLLNTLWDSGSTLSFITNQRARRLQLRGKPIKLEVVSIGGEVKTIESMVYTLSITDDKLRDLEICVIGINTISSEIHKIDLSPLSNKFKTVNLKEINPPQGGQIDLLIGIQYAAYHPICCETRGNLVLMQNRFGYVIAVSHPEIKDKTTNMVAHANIQHINDQASFFELESMGISSFPICGNCKCGQCHLGGKNMSIKDEKEYDIIRSNISFNVETGRFIASYPWIRNREMLPNNRCVALATLNATERRLGRNDEYARLYSRQIEDMIDRKAARKVSEAELANYQGAKYYIAHHAVLKPESRTTPCRIVFNSSAQFHGLSLNDYLAKGPSLLNQLLGILLIFRERRVAFIGDISKMFHAIAIPFEDQMVHLFL